MQSRAIDFIFYNVSSMATARPFYRDTLGLQPLGDTTGDSWQEFDLGNVTLAIGAFEAVPSGGQQGGATVAIAVADLNATVLELRGKGVPVVQGPDEWGTCFMATIKDPDGNSIMLHQRKDGTAG
jgi:predicted enzyme related to lactoylglutathione lyase